MTTSTESTVGRFGPYGGRYVPETLIRALEELESAFIELQRDSAFLGELASLQRDYIGRPTPITRAGGLEALAGVGAPHIWLKREDLCHTGSHKLNNALGQALIARSMGRERLIAETGAGQHGVATATAAALLGLPCRVYMGADDVTRQRLNVVRMELLGAEIVAVDSGSRTLKDATNEAIRDWMASYRETHYVIGSVVGPHPYPTIVRTLQRIIGVEARAQILEREGRLPSALIACVGGGSNALGLFHAFIDDDDVAMIGVEAGGTGTPAGMHAASVSRGTPGVLHGALSYLLQDDDGAIEATHSIAAGLDYPGVGPEHAWLRDQGRAQYRAVDDASALGAYRALARSEGIIPALESAHAIAYALEHAADCSSDDVLLVCLSGRGDKDVGRDDARVSQ